MQGSKTSNRNRHEYVGMIDTKTLPLGEYLDSESISWYTVQLSRRMSMELIRGCICARITPVMGRKDSLQNGHNRQVPAR